MLYPYTPTNFFSKKYRSKNKPTIALISDHADPAAIVGSEEAGGQNVYVRQVGENLAALGWHVDMFTRQADADAPTIVEHTPNCRTIRLAAGPQKFIPRDELLPHMPEFVRSFRQFSSESGLNYPLIHTNYWLSAWVGLQLKRDLNVQLVHTYHSLGAVKYQTMVELPAVAEQRLATEKAILETATCVIATSPQEKEMFRQLVSRQGQVEVIPCGTNISNFVPIPKIKAKQHLGWQSDDRLILYVGRFDRRKGIETLVRAFARLPEAKDLKLVIVGGSSPDLPDGREKERIQKLVGELGIGERTVFVGRVGHDLLPYYYSAAEVCVVPSYYEPFGLVAIEAMACGTAVIASNVGGLKYTVIPEETGLLVPPQNESALADALTKIFGDRVWAKKLRKQAAASVIERFSWTNVATQLSDLYRYVLARTIVREHPWNLDLFRAG
jgi:D-inositol-3-phosphate glycosyltransferase